MSRSSRDRFAECWFLTGATAVGKTRVGLALARRLGAEIIALDSMTVYRGMDIGTAKPTIAERAEVHHHLLDIVDPADEYSVAQYVEAASAKVSELRARGRKVLFVGGTPLYLKSLLRGLFDGPPANWELRHEIEDELIEVGQAALHERLLQIDPVAASNIHPHDTRRLIRALEVYRATGEPLSHQQTEFEEGRGADECRVFVLRRGRSELHRQIDGRVETMIDGGLVDEVRQLTAGDRQLGRTASQAVGYREALAFLAGEYDEHMMTERIKARTRRFAKRQGTWFRSLTECRFIDIAGEVDVATLTDQIAVAGEVLA
jgi:tRNA dimethylallyltransferase